MSALILNLKVYVKGLNPEALSVREDVLPGGSM